MRRTSQYDVLLAKSLQKSFQVTRRSRVTWKDFCSDEASKTSYWEVRSHRICIVVNYKHKSYLVIFKKILFRQQKNLCSKLGKVMFTFYKMLEKVMFTFYKMSEKVMFTFYKMSEKVMFTIYVSPQTLLFTSYFTENPNRKLSFII